MQAASRPSGRAASGARRASVDAVGWLRSNVVDVVAVLPANPIQSVRGATGGRSPSQLDEALARWARRFARQRLFVLAPRGLLLALSLDALIALVFAVSGSGLNLAVVLCLSAPPLVGMAVALASSRRDPSRREVARVLDRDLALDERVGTAVELSGSGLAVDGLAALVLAEATAALVTSRLSGARPTHRSAQREWLASGGALLMVALQLVLIAGRGESPGPVRLAARTSAGGPAAATTQADAGGAKHPRNLTTARIRNVGSGRRETTASLRSAGQNSALSVVTQQQSSAAGRRLAAGGGNQRAALGASSRSGSQSAGLGKAGKRSAGGGGAGGAASRAGRSASAQARTHSGGSAHGGRAGSSRGAASHGHATSPQRVGAGSRAGTFNSTRIFGFRGSAKSPATGSSQTHGKSNSGSPSVPALHAKRSPRAPNSQGHSVGNSAGTGSGGNPYGRPETKGLRSGSAKLPVQAGYTPARDKSGPKRGNPDAGSGGIGRARSSTEKDGGSATAVTLPYIAPSSDIGPVDNALLQNYFSFTVSRRW